MVRFLLFHTETHFYGVFDPALQRTKKLLHGMDPLSLLLFSHL